MVDFLIPFNHASFGPQALEYVRQAVVMGKTAGDGPLAKKCEAQLSTIVGGGRVFLTPSCTAALEMAATLLGIGKDDEVIVPSFTFTSSANAFVLFGAKPVFVDSRADTLNMDEAQVEQAITSRTKAIVVMHYAGVACEMGAILAIAKKHGIPVIEDNAHGLFGSHQGRPLGSFGAIATQSFHETKNLGCGEGGAIVINDASLIARAEMLREKGTNRMQFHRGQVDKYSWVDTGSSWLVSEFQAAVLLDQLERAKEIQASRFRVWDAYARELAPWAQAQGVRLPSVPKDCGHPAHAFYLLLPTAQMADRFMAHMKERGILAVSHYVPLHASPMGRKFGGQAGDCPVMEDFSTRLVRLPLFATLDDLRLMCVVDAVKAWSK